MGLEQQILLIFQNIYDRFGWLGVVAMMVFENATSISPSEIILSLAGWLLLASKGASEPMIFIGGFYTALGSTFGASITYWIVRLGGRPLVDRVSTALHIQPAYIRWVERLFHRYGPGLVLVGRLIPGLRNLVTIPAGLVRMPYSEFFLYTLVGTYIWCTFFIGLGYAIGHEWHLISRTLTTITPWILAGLVGFVIAGLIILQAIKGRISLQNFWIPSEEEE